MDALTTDHAYYRAEFDWLATDDEGQVALISSAGYGPVAPTAVEDAPILLDIERELMLLEVVGEAIAVAPGGTTREWWEIARRGVYVFDWKNSCYEMILTPERPIEINGLEAAVRDVALRARLPIRFSEIQQFPASLGVRSYRR